ncbi:MAG: hypothetical protein GXY83_00030 [Rhodopirellula sp.]|nr:hypothetical protein [Rhodopirellula sp.]
MTILHESLETGRVRLVPKASGEPDRYVVFEGGVTGVPPAFSVKLGRLSELS